MIEKMRAEIEALGGEIRFEQRVTDLRLEPDPARRWMRAAASRCDCAGWSLASGEQIDCRHLVLAVGHSARDTFALLHERGVYLEPKPFSVGFRIEHPQGVIDRARFGPSAGHPILGAADYRLVHHAKNGRSAYSFCMCPGGTVVAATSEPERVVTNGMSQYSRNERNANAGIVVGINPADYRQDGRVGDTTTPVNPLDGIAFQRVWESSAFALGGGDYIAPGLLDEGATVPFIARYRKEATGGLDDTQLRNLEERLGYLRELEERRAVVLKSIEEQGKLTEELRADIAARTPRPAWRTSTCPMCRSAAPRRRSPARRAWSRWPRRCWADPAWCPRRRPRRLPEPGPGRRRHQGGPGRRPPDPHGAVRRGRRAGGPAARAGLWRRASCSPGWWRARSRRAPSSATTSTPARPSRACPRTAPWPCSAARRKRSSSSNW
jgi:hypothetical protein